METAARLGQRSHRDLVNRRFSLLLAHTFYQKLMKFILNIFMKQKLHITEKWEYTSTKTMAATNAVLSESSHGCGSLKLGQYLDAAKSKTCRYSASQPNPTSI